jgi:hypothetical protein
MDTILTLNSNRLFVLLGGFSKLYAVKKRTPAFNEVVEFCHVTNKLAHN